MEIDKEFNKGYILMLLSRIKREGMQGLINFIEKETDYFDAPASTRYHLSCPGGLAQHHRNVYDFFKDRCKEFNLGLSKDSIIIVSLLHDICKCGLYQKTNYSYKCDNIIKNQGHAKRSIELLTKYIKLTAEEEAIIKYHMGTFGVFDYNDIEIGEYKIIDIHKSIKRYASVQIFAACDMGSSKFEKCFDNK
ncbi:MAG: metal-dependent phosphohydrolase [Nanoarchaeota archaeon]|nr:metal-dependent phosphohydrolase [Nanoarchaeota archaeon]